VQRHVQGQVAVRVSISIAGEVDSADSVEGDSILAAAALEASKQWKFKTWKYGKYIPLPAWAILDFEFKIPSSSAASNARILIPGCCSNRPRFDARKVRL
jgi:TonB family protein